MRRLKVERPLNSRTRDPMVSGEGRSLSKDTNASITNGGESGVGRGTGSGSSKDRGIVGPRSGGVGRGAFRDIYTPSDFGVGYEVWIHGRRFRIVDADLNTRQWYERCLGRALNPPEEYPEDGYGAQRTKVSVPKKR